MPRDELTSCASTTRQARRQISPRCRTRSFIVARNRETLALLTWEPYMHNPKLRHRLHRVNAPALFLRGASDGIVSAGYLERYAALVPNARIETIAAAGHLPHVEQPAATAAKVLQFLNG
jgi:pimeloyl-ACP methyl ester carboxylesterase